MDSHSKQQMESRMSLSTSTDTERELNGSNEQRDWSRSNRVSSAHMVQAHFKLFGGYWRGGEVHWRWEKMQAAHTEFHVTSPFHSWTCQLWTSAPRRTSPCSTLQQPHLLNVEQRHIYLLDSFFSFLVSHHHLMVSVSVCTHTAFSVRTNVSRS